MFRRSAVVLSSIVIAACSAAPISAEHRPPVHPLLSASTLTQSRERPNPFRQRNCQAAIQTAIGHDRLPILRGWSRSDRSAEVFVNPGFYRLDPGNRRATDEVFRCAVSEGRIRDQDLRRVIYRDAASGRQVARWNVASGFQSR